MGKYGRAPVEANQYTGEVIPGICVNENCGVFNRLGQKQHHVHSTKIIFPNTGDWVVITGQPSYKHSSKGTPDGSMVQDGVEPPMVMDDEYFQKNYPLKLG